MSEEAKPSDDALINEIMGEEIKPETPEAVEAKPEEKPEAKKEEKSEQPEKKFVDHGAFHEERERRKELQRRLENETAERKKIEERFSKVLETVSKPQEDEYLDPVERLQRDVNKISDTVNNARSQTEEDRARFQKDQDFINRYKGSAEAFIKSNPEFPSAYNFLIDQQRRILSKAYGEEKANVALSQYERSIVEAAYDAEKNPASVLFEMAVEQGYKKKADEIPKKTIEHVEKSLEASKSLSSGGQPDSDAGIEKMSMREINELSDEEFDRHWKELEKRSKKRA